jgi:hypothetical protein
MIKLKFIWLLWCGIITPTEQHEGVQMYSIKTEEWAIDNAYKLEILDYIKTGEFKYNTTLDEACVNERDIVYDCIDEEQFYKNN